MELFNGPAGRLPAGQFLTIDFILSKVTNDPRQNSFTFYSRTRAVRVVFLANVSFSSLFNKEIVGRSLSEKDDVRISSTNELEK